MLSFGVYKNKNMNTSVSVNYIYICLFSIGISLLHDTYVYTLKAYPCLFITKIKTIQIHPSENGLMFYKELKFYCKSFKFGRQ